MSGSTRELLDALRSTRVLVLHPADHEREALLGQLRRIGCEAQAAWPAPRDLPMGVDVVFLLVEQGSRPSPTWTIAETGPTLIAIIEYENPVALKALLDSNAHGVVVKPLRPFGILSALALARALHGYARRVEAKARRLEETLRARRDVEKAARILAAMRGVSESQAYELIRAQATRKRVSMAVIAARLIDAQDVLKDLAPE